MKEIKVFNKDLKDDFKTKLTKIIHEFDKLQGGVGNRNIIKIINLE